MAKSRFHEPLRDKTRILRSLRFGAGQVIVRSGSFFSLGTLPRPARHGPRHLSDK